MSIDKHNSQLSNEVNFMNKHKEKFCGNESLVLTVSLFSFSLGCHTQFRGFKLRLSPTNKNYLLSKQKQTCKQTKSEFKEK